MKGPLYIFLWLTLFSCRSNETDNYSHIDTSQSANQSDTVVKRHFPVAIDFDKYRIDISQSKKITINLSSNPTARQFRSAIDSSIDKQGTNFAGHYNLVRWGCGTSCINGAITDMKTGKVYDLPPATLDYKFRNDSRLLVVNPPDDSGYFEDCGYCEPELWIWNERIKKFEKQK